MAIRGNLSEGVQDLGASSADQVLHNFSNRTAITGFSVQNNAGADATVQFYLSPDNTSAAGELVATYTIADGDSEFISELIGQGIPENTRVIAVVTTSGLSAGDLNAIITYTLYTGAS